MELQLGLALPSHPIPTKSTLDAMNLLGSFSWNNKPSFGQVCNFEHYNTQALVPTTLSLLPLTPCHPNDDDNQQGNHSSITKSNGDDAEEVVGWPTVNSSRKKLRQDNYGVQVAEISEERTVMVNRSGSDHLRGSNNKLYVKVKMDGVGIARKIDLGLHRSFESLKETLLEMFGKCYQEYSNSYKLAYQDIEGDWLLAEDVPWRSFVECVQRLKLMKTSG